MVPVLRCPWCRTLDLPALQPFNDTSRSTDTIRNTAPGRCHHYSATPATPQACPPRIHHLRTFPHHYRIGRAPHHHTFLPLGEHYLNRCAGFMPHRAATHTYTRTVVRLKEQLAVHTTPYPPTLDIWQHSSWLFAPCYLPLETEPIYSDTMGGLVFVAYTDGWQPISRVPTVAYTPPLPLHTAFRPFLGW